VQERNGDPRAAGEEAPGIVISSLEETSHADGPQSYDIKSHQGGSPLSSRFEPGRTAKGGRLNTDGADALATKRKIHSGNNALNSGGQRGDRLAKVRASMMMSSSLFDIGGTERQPGASLDSSNKNFNRGAAIKQNIFI